MIHETIVTTRSPQGRVHVAPMGVRRMDGRAWIAPFKPSVTLDNLRATGVAVVNATDDVTVFAGCLTGRIDWPLSAASVIDGVRLAGALSHLEVAVEGIEDDPQRPRFACRILHEAVHAPFAGFNRAQAAVIEAAILVSRLHMLPREKVDREIGYLAIAIDKTAGDRERLAWQWLLDAIAAHDRDAGSAA
ncbi:MAG: DUF447 domain-containing protein [Gammaproteobacteria bacterium]